MTLYHQTRNRDKVLFVNGISRFQSEALVKYGEMMGRPLYPLLLLDHKQEPPVWAKDLEGLIVLKVDFDDLGDIQTTLQPYADSILTATCLGERNIPLLRKIIPFIPYSVLPTETSLKWATEKIRMRSLLRAYDRKIAPNFLAVSDAEPETLDNIEKRVGYPMVVKPSGLAAALLVSVCYHREELEKVLKQTTKKLDQLYKVKRGRGEPQLLVEEFMEGDMYSIDAYVNARGVVYFAPLVYVKTGREIGFDDFFGYMRMTPTLLNAASTAEAQLAATQGIKALGMRSTTCHIELLRTEKGWKVIELGPRMGGWRNEMYRHSFGIDHSLNDMLIRVSQRPILPKKAKGYTAVLHFYARTEGKLDKISGLAKVQALSSLQRLTIHKQPGEKCLYAKNGGDPVMEVTLFDPVRSNVLADIRRIEQHLKIITT